MPPRTSRRNASTPARARPLPENVSRVNRPPTLYNAYLPHDNSYIDMPFDPTKSWKDYILHPVQDQNDACEERQHERYINNRAMGYPLISDEDNAQIISEFARNEALEHIDNVNDGNGGALYSTLDRTVYFNKRKDLNHAKWLHENRMLPTLRYSQSTGTYEFLQPGETSDIHQYRELMQDGQYSQSDYADSDHHTEESPNKSFFGHFPEDYESDANNEEGEGEGEVEIEIESED